MIETDPNISKIFSGSNRPVTLEFIKGCLVGTAKTIIVKSLKYFNDDFPNVESNDMILFKLSIIYKNFIKHPKVHKIKSNIDHGM